MKKAQSIFAVRSLTLDDMIRSEEFQNYQSEKVVGYGETYDRFDRCQDAAESGEDGSTHAEIFEHVKDSLINFEELEINDKFESLLVQLNNRISKQEYNS